MTSIYDTTPYTIYGAAWCSFCQKAKQLCEEKSLPYTYIDVDSGNALEELVERLGTTPKTIPQIFHGAVLVGGFTELKELHNS